MDELYNALRQHYYDLQGELRDLRNQHSALSARIDAIESESLQIEYILCKHGNHIYEHFEKNPANIPSEEI